MKAKTTIIIILMSFYFSCDSSLEMDVADYESRLVVNCFFNPDDYWTVHVSRSLALLDTDIIIGYRGRPDVIESITNANVFIYENDILIDSLNYSSIDSLFKLGYYLSDINKPNISDNYRVEVAVPGFKTVYGEDKIPEHVEINSVTITDSIHTIVSIDTGFYNKWQYGLEIDIRDKPQVDNYYLISVSYDQPHDTDINYQPFSSSDPVILADAAEISINGSRIVARGYFADEGEFAGFGAIFSDRLFKDQSYPLKIDNIFVDENMDPRNFSVRMTSLSESCYKYLLNISQRINAEVEQNPFAEPIIVYNNIKNGAGIFAGYSTVKVPGSEWVKQLE